LSRIGLYLDEDAMGARLVTALRSRGIDLLTAREGGMVNRLDEDHLAFASTQNRVLYSFNVSDYARIHTVWTKAGQSHSGIVVAQQKRWPVGEQVRRLARLIDTVTLDQMKGRIEFLGQW
jgi:hypothetical protein